MCLSHGHGDCKIIMIKGGGGCWWMDQAKATAEEEEPHPLYSIKMDHRIRTHLGAIKCGSDETNENDCSSWLLQLLLVKIRDVVAFMATKTAHGETERES